MKQLVRRENGESTPESAKPEPSSAGGATSGPGSGFYDSAGSRDVFQRMGAAIARGQVTGEGSRRQSLAAFEAPLQRKSSAKQTVEQEPIQRLILPGHTALTPSHEGVLQRLEIIGDLEEGEYYLIENNGFSIGMFEGSDENEELIEYHFHNFITGEDIFLDSSEENAHVTITHIPDDDLEEMAEEIIEEDDIDMEDMEMDVDDEEEGLPLVANEALNFQFEGLNVGQILTQLRDQDELVVQGKFLAKNFNAPVGAWVIMTAPIGGGGAPGANPPGWVSGLHPNHHNRGHLIGKQFGGGGGLNNLVTLTDGTNHPAMTVYENALAKTVKAAGVQTFFYKVTPGYLGGFFKNNSFGVKIIQHPAPASVKIYAKNLATGGVIYNNVVIANGLLQNHKACVD